MQLTLIRQGIPDRAECDRLLLALSSLPASDRFSVNWFLAELLVALDAPNATEFSVQHLAAAGTQEEQVQFAKTLIRSKHGWTPEFRQVMLDWLNRNKQLPGGRLVNFTLQAMREDFESSFTEEDRQHFQKDLELLHQPADADNQGPLLSHRQLVQNWSLDELDTELETLSSVPYNAEIGRRAFTEALCLRCHQFQDRGSHVGPDLTNVGKRMNRRALLESILEPSKQIDPKYSNSIYVLDDGQVISGRTAMVVRDQISVEIDQLTGKTVAIPRIEIVESKLSPVSPMPQGLLNTFSAEELHHLIQYLRQADMTTSVKE